MTSIRVTSSWLFVLTFCAGLYGPVCDAAVPRTIRVGQLTLTLCNSDYTGYCGAVERPLDPRDPGAGSVSIGFEFYPRSDQTHSRLGTILPQEGGPGYSSTGTRDFYLALFDALRDRRDVLIVDKRGTGLSAPIDCPALQTGATDLDSVSACARQLGGAAWYYGTDYAANDIVAVLDALDIDDVDFYGDSYGTFVGQVLAALHPGRLRSIILDSAYPVRPPDPWFSADWAAAWHGIDLSCNRSVSCRSLGGPATARMTRVIDAARAHPLRGRAPDGDGVLQPTSVDPESLLFLIDSAGYGPPIYRDLDAAARAWLEAGDALPLLRLVAEVSTASASDPVDYSYGLATAVTCSDYPLLYDLRRSQSVRDRQYARALEEARAERPNEFAPFTFDEGIRSQVYITPLDSCLPWPVPRRDLAPGKPGEPLPPKVRFPDVPTLILSGDLDSVTSVVDADQTAEQFPNAMHIVVPNLGHVVADGDDVGCTLGIVQHFIQHLSAGDAGCVKRVRPVRTVPTFGARAADLAPLTAVTGNKTTAAQRRMAASGLEAVGDVVARYFVSYNYVGSGLRGGRFDYGATPEGYDFNLEGVRFTSDLAAWGTVSWNQLTSIVSATVDLKHGGAVVAHLKMEWDDSKIDAIATVTGTVQGVRLNAQRIAP